MEAFKSGLIKNYEEFMALSNKDSTSHTWRSGFRLKEDDGMKPGKRCYQRKKAASLQMIENGVPESETPWRKWRANNAAWFRNPTNCPHCGITLANPINIRRHIIRIHEFCASRREPLSEQDVAAIEEMRRAGSLSKDWKWQRKGRTTATRANRICKLTRADLYRLAYTFLMSSGSGYKSPAMKRGLELEPKAVKEYEKYMNILDVKYPVGFCVHPEKGIFGATPDALIGTNGCLEVKCPICPISEISKRKGSNFLVQDARGPRGLRLNRKHAYFDQVVMQIICTGRKYCDFAVFYQDDANPATTIDLWIERIERKEAEEAWAIREPKLLNFFEKHLGPVSLYMGYSYI